MPGTAAPTTLEEALAENAALRAHIKKLDARIQMLERRLDINSQNSSKPPSTDPPDLKRPPKKKPSGRKRGGQPGHKGHHRELLPPEQVDEFQDHYPATCTDGGCGRSLPKGRGRQKVGEPTRHQVTDIPPIEPHVTEHLCHAVQCGCGHVTRATLPRGVPRGAFGPRLQALVALFSGVYRVSKRGLEDVLADVFKVKISLGSVKACEQAVSEALATPVSEAREFVQQQAVLNVDETGWWQRNERAWLWVAVAATVGVAVFQVHWKRGKKAAAALLGSFAGWLVSDRWCAYEDHALERRQLCWAHLKRHFKAMQEFSGEVGRLGKELVTLTEQMFRWWRALRDGRMKRSTFRRKMGPVRDRIDALILEGAHTSVKAVRGMCWELHRLSDAMWTFVDVEGIEPTNNSAERALRHAVIWRRISFGTQSDAGSRFVERMLTTTASLRMQERNVLEYLTDLMESSHKGEPYPSLLPDGHEGVEMAAA